MKGRRLPVVDVAMMVKKQDWHARVATDDQARAMLALKHPPELRQAHQSLLRGYVPS